MLFRGEEVSHAEVETLVKLDLEWYRDSYAGTEDQDRQCLVVQTILMNAEFADFMDVESRYSDGLLVMGVSLESPERSGSTLSKVIPEVVGLFQQEVTNAVLVHAAGLRNNVDPGPATEECEWLKGTIGCLRSLCVQIVRWCMTNEVHIEEKEVPAAVNRDGPVTNDSLRLCRLFRAMLLGMATFASNTRQHYTVVVIIDDTYILESDDDFRWMVFFFRAIRDGSYFGDLHNAVTFKYVLLHPTVSQMIERPDIAECIALFPTTMFEEANTEQDSRQLDKGKMAVYRTVSSKTKATVKPIGLVRDFPLGSYPDRSQIEEAMGVVEGHIEDMQEMLDERLLSALKFDENTTAGHSSHPIATQELIVALKSLLASEASRLKGHPSETKDTFVAGIQESLKDFPWRYDFALMRQKMMDIEFVILRANPPNLPVMEYPGRYTQIWTPSMHSATARSKTSVRDRFQALYDCFQHDPESSEVSSALSIAESDFKYCFNAEFKLPEIFRPKLNELTSKYLESSSALFRFRGVGQSGGMIILGCDLLRTVTPMFWSPSSLLLARYIRLWQVPYQGIEIPAIVLRHFAGLRNSASNQRKKQLFWGATGLMRSLCEQLVTQPAINMPFGFVDSMGFREHNDLREDNLDALCNLWRELLIDLTRESRAGGHPRTVFVAIDGIEWLEAEDKAGFFYVVDFFRALCDEMNGAQLLGRELRFNYVLVHAGFSELLSRPHPTERIAVCPFHEVSPKPSKINLADLYESRFDESAMAPRSSTGETTTSDGRGKKKLAKPSRSNTEETSSSRENGSQKSSKPSRTNSADKPFLANIEAVKGTKHGRSKSTRASVASSSDDEAESNRGVKASNSW